MGYYIKKTNDPPALDDTIAEEDYEALANQYIQLEDATIINARDLLQALFDDLFSGSDKDVKASEFDWGIEDDTAL